MGTIATPLDRLQETLARLDAELAGAADDESGSRLVVERHRVAAAIGRWHDGRWGRCCDCNGEIAHALLLVDAAAAFCSTCSPPRRLAS